MGREPQQRMPWAGTPEKIQLLLEMPPEAGWQRGEAPFSLPLSNLPSVFSGQTYHAREMQFSRKQSRVVEGLGTDLRTKGELIDEPNNHILLKVVSSWRTGTTSSFPVYTHHQFSTTSKMFNVYVLSESACNLGCIRHLEGSNQILSATCLWSP